jgi:hypothetical protein
MFSLFFFSGGLCLPVSRPQRGAFQKKRKVKKTRVNLSK